MLLFVCCQVYEHPYKAILDGVETEGLLEIDPDKHVEIFRMGNGSTEVLEIHDFKHVSIYETKQKGKKRNSIGMFYLYDFIFLTNLVK